MKTKLIISLLMLSGSLFAQNTKQEVLLLGTFHFNNPGMDVAKTKSFDIMSAKSQKELDVLSSKIKNYGPNKIFVEWSHNEQSTLDSLYDFYLKDQYFAYVAKKYPNRKFYIQDETIQLAFRTAKKAGHTKVYGIDYHGAGDFPYDSLMKVAEQAQQKALIKEINEDTEQYVKTSNKEFESLPLTQILINRNKNSNRRNDIGSYISQFNRAGGLDNFVGAYLNSEWYKRNLYMYALLQKSIEPKDTKVMVLLGSSHIAMFKEFIDLDNKLKSVELVDILKK
jgi:Family of unknown function (DUF5694)